MTNPKDNFNKHTTPRAKLSAQLTDVINGLPGRLKTSLSDKSIVLIPFDKYEPKAFGETLFKFKKDLHNKFENVDFTFDAVEGIHGKFLMLVINPDTQHTFDMVDQMPNTWVEHFHRLNEALGDNGFAKYMTQRTDDSMVAYGTLLYVAEKGADMADIPMYWDVNPAWIKPALLPKYKETAKPNASKNKNNGPKK